MEFRRVLFRSVERAGVAVAAWPRRPGAGALQRPHRALSATVRARQHAGLPALDGRTILPCAAPAGVTQMAQAADLLHAEEHVAPSRSHVAIERTGATALPECH